MVVTAEAMDANYTGIFIRPRIRQNQIDMQIERADGLRIPFPALFFSHRHCGDIQIFMSDTICL
jgi:hypothetical protein